MVFKVKPEFLKEAATGETMRWIPAEASSTSSFVAIYFWEQSVSTVGLDGNYVVDLSSSNLFSFCFKLLSQMLSPISCVTPLNI